MERAMQQELDSTYPVTEAHVAFFQAQGYVKLPAVFSASLLACVGPRIERIVHAHQGRQPALTQRVRLGVLAGRQSLAPRRRHPRVLPLGAVGCPGRGPAASGRRAAVP